MQKNYQPWDKRSIESYLRAYPVLKRQLEIIGKDLDEMLAPQAVSYQAGGRLRPRIVKEAARGGQTVGRRFGPSGPLVLMPKLVWVGGEIETAGSNCRHADGYADPTAAKAMQLVEIKEQLEQDDDYQRMKQLVKAVDQVMKSLRERQLYGTERQAEDARLKKLLLVERYFKNKLSETGVFVKLNIPERTYYKWKKEIVNMVNENLQFLCSKPEERRVIIVS